LVGFKIQFGIKVSIEDKEDKNVYETVSQLNYYTSKIKK
jgi:hypothetical protein